jgi:hypothetical protein
VGSARPGRVLVATLTPESTGNALAERAQDPGRLPPDRPAQRVATASARVSSQCPGDLLGEDEGVAQSDTLYRCLDQLLAHKKPFFSYLGARWQDLFGVRFEVLLYDLTSTYFASDPPGYGKRQFGYSGDQRFDCVPVVIALIVTPQGFPLAYEVLAGNTADQSTLPDFLDWIEEQ